MCVRYWFMVLGFRGVGVLCCSFHLLFCFVGVFSFSVSVLCCVLKNVVFTDYMFVCCFVIALVV